MLAVAGCEDLRRVDAAMRRVDWLDRALDPTGVYAGPLPPPAPVVAETMPPPPQEEPAPLSPAPAPEPVGWEEANRAAAPAPAPPASLPRDPAARMRTTLRQNPWVTRFWSELTPSQRGRVAARLGDHADPAAAWDPMGLNDRIRLVFGSGLVDAVAPTSEGGR